MATDFSYASIADFNKYFNRVNEFDSKRQVYNPSTNSNLHTFHNVGFVDVFFINGDEQGASNSSDDTPNANNEWLYTASENKLEYYNDTYTATTINEQIFEVGQDFTNFLNQTLVDASLELHNYVDARYATPFEKQKQIDLDSPIVTNRVEEYDPIIIKSVCYIAAANLIRAKEGMSEEADYYHGLVTNEARTGIVDKLNDGIYKLSHEVDAKDAVGKILYKSVVSAGLDLVELAGEYEGEHYDLLRIDIDTAGVYGTATFTVKYLSNDKLEGATKAPQIITGGLQEIHNGLYGRFQGSAADADDFWNVEVYGNHRKQTNKSNSTIEMVR